MANMGDSQFKTFRADVRREVRNVSDEIRSNIYGAVVAEARSVAASVARKTEDQRFIALHRENEVLIANLENLTVQLNSQVNIIEALTRRVEDLEEKPDPSATVNTTYTTLEPGEIVAGFVTKGSGPLPRPREQVEDGDKLIHNGETFYWWFGRWRRLSELEGFASWIAHRARSK